MILLWRVLYRLYRFFSGARYRMARRFTRAGGVALVGFCFAGLMGADMESTVAYQAFSLVLFPLMVSFCLGWWFRGRLSATRRLPRFATVGQRFSYAVCLQNLTGRVQS